jgi:hypothetical protein
VRFSYGAVRKHMKQHHPKCPLSVVDAIAQIVVLRDWPSPKIGEAVGISMQIHVRHKMTEYDGLYSIPGMDKAAARLTVKSKVQVIISAWSDTEVINAETSPPEGI